MLITGVSSSVSLVAAAYFEHIESFSANSELS